MKDINGSISRRKMLMGTAAALTGIAVVTVQPATAKGRSARED